MSARSLARRRSVQNQPCGRRRSSPPSVSASTAVRAPGPKSGRSATVRGDSAAAAHRCGPEDVGVVGVEDVGLDGLAEERLRVGDQVGVERVVAGDHHAEGVPGAATGPADLLPQCGAGAGEAREQDGVEAADVDAELERVGRGQAEQSPGTQRLLELATLLGEVAAAVGGDLVDERGIDLREQAPGGQGDGLGSAARPDEGEGAHPVDDQVGQQVGDLARGRAPRRRAVLADAGHERRLPQRQRHATARRPVVGDGGDLETGQPGG